jgi:hypothetical protein
VVRHQYSNYASSAQTINMDTGHGVLTLTVPQELLHWMFGQQIQDKSKRLHEIDPVTWLSIALGPVLDAAERHMRGMELSVISSPTPEEQKTLTETITGFINLKTADKYESYPFFLKLPPNIWVKLHDRIQSLGIDSTQDCMPVTCQLLGGHIILKKDAISTLAVGDVIQLKDTYLNKGCALLTGELIPETIVKFEDNTLCLADIAVKDPITNQNPTEATLTIHLININTTLGVIKSLTDDNSTPISFKSSIGNNIKLKHQQHTVAAGELVQLGNIFGIQIRNLTNG